MQPCPESHWNWLLSVPFDEYTRHLTVLHGVCPRWTAKISSIAPERTLILPKAVVAASVGASEAAPASEPEPVDSPHISDYPPEMIVKDIAELKVSDQSRTGREKNRHFYCLPHSIRSVFWNKCPALCTSVHVNANANANVSCPPPEGILATVHLGWLKSWIPASSRSRLGVSFRQFLTPTRTCF